MTIFERAMINDIKYFKDNTFDINQKDDSGKSILHYAVIGNAFEVINELIKRGVNVNIQDNNLETPLFDCARKGKLEIAKILIINYAKVNITNKDHETPFHLASAKGNKEFLKLLVENDAIPNTLTNDKKYPVHYAILAGKIDVIKYLLTLANQPFTLLDFMNNTLLHFAATTTNDLLIFYLISEGLNPNLMNKDLETPLFNAVRFGTKETVNALLHNDAYINIKNKNNETPLDYAKIYERYQIKTLLENYQMLPKYERLVKNQSLTVATLNRDYKELGRLIKNSQTMRNDKHNFSALDYANLYDFKEAIKLLKNCPVL
ncbi:MAG: ankyrin repeat domain-containing protein [Acholeplasma sp.]|nr:ankyrin repeat domain-containing protein [Acholeplasma sp.]